MTTSISVFGLGYVGCVSAACFAKEGHAVTGVDVNPAKVDMIMAGKATIVEAGIGELVAEMVESGRLTATTSVEQAVQETAVSLVCVGTPSRANGSLDLSYVERVSEQIGQAIRSKAARHVIVIRSTVLPGTIHDVVVPALERTSGKKAGTDFGVCGNPEFLREGTSIRDFYDPPFTLVGADDAETGRVVAALYQGIEATVHVIPVRTAEMVKYSCNCFHGLKVAFANEIGNICKATGVDSHEVMRIFCEDRKLNISPYYLRPGIRVRRVLLAQGFAGHGLQCPSPRCAGASIGGCAGKQSPPDREGFQHGHGHGPAAGRCPRLEFQGGNGRSA